MIGGSFDFRPYQLTLAVGVILYCYSLLISIYYILPVNKEKKKFIPGLSDLSFHLMPSQNTPTHAHSLNILCFFIGFSSILKFFIKDEEIVININSRSLNLYLIVCPLIRLFVNIMYIHASPSLSFCFLI